MNTLLLHLGSILIYSAAGLCVFLMLLNRRLILIPNGKAKIPLILLVFVAIMAGSAAAGIFFEELPWVLAPAAVLCLIAVGEVHRAQIRRSCAGSGPIGSKPHAVALFNPVTTTDVIVHRYEVRHPHWNGAPLRVAHVTDLHVHAAAPIEYYQHILELAEKTQPDIAVFTGDFISQIASLPNLRNALRPIGKIATFAVLGNHDYWTDPEAVSSVVTGSGLRLLTNESITVSVDGRSIVVTGYDYPWRIGGKLVPTANTGLLHLVLSHNPDNIYRLAELSADMVFSGHYHAGQIRLPFLGAIVVPSVYGRRFDHGHFVVDGAHLFVPAGVGASSPRFRIYCQPDIFIVDIQGESEIVHRELKNPNPHPPLQVWGGGF